MKDGVKAEVKAAMRMASTGVIQMIKVGKGGHSDMIIQITVGR